MEQKTEASQAVEPMRAVLQEILDIEEIRLWLIEKDHFSHVYWFKSKQEDYAARSAGLLDKVRAALKAQPAPTEAAQYPNTPEIDALMEKWSDDGATRGAAFIELRDKARQIERAFYAAVEQARTMAYAAQGNPSNNSSSSAQGEDSARLDAERYRYFRRIYGAEARLIRGPIYAAETPEQFDAGIDECIRYEQEVARASAETGGVKP